MKTIQKIVGTFVVAAALWATGAACADAKPKETGFYTRESFIAALQKMGYDATLTSNNLVLFNLKRDSTTASFLADLDADKMYLSIKLTHGYGDHSKIPAKILLRLLEENESLSPAFFSLLKATMYLSRWFDNRERSAEAWRTVIEDMMSTAQRTQELWNPKEVQDLAKAEDAAASPAPSASPK